MGPLFLYCSHRSGVLNAGMSDEIRDRDASLLCEQQTFQIRGAVFEVSRTIGRGFLEAVYQERLGLEFQMRSIPFRALPGLKLAYKGAPLRQTYQPDFICFENVIVELKVARELAPEHRAQLCNYLKATGLHVGLLVNFGGSGPATIERMVRG